jgi:hypothetical protein
MWIFFVLQLCISLKFGLFVIRINERKISDILKDLIIALLNYLPINTLWLHLNIKFNVQDEKSNFQGKFSWEKVVFCKILFPSNLLEL